MIHRIHPLRSALIALFIFGASLTTHAAPPVLLDITTADLASFKTEKDPVLSLDNSSGSPALKIEFPANSGYPGVDLPIPGGSIDLSAYAGIEVELSNISQTRLNIGLRVDNPGDWRKQPWNSTNIWLSPGDTKTIKLTFGESYGKPGYALDASRVSNIKLLADKPKQTSAILVKAVRTFGTASATSAVVAPAQQAAAAASPADSGVLFTPTADNISSIQTEKDPVLTMEGDALKITFPNAGNYPGLNFPLAGGQLNLSSFAGVQATVTNVGQSRLNVALRADNPGDWRKEPWNIGNVWISPGETKTIQVVFGQSYGNPGYPLDPSRVSVLKLYVDKPKAGAAILVKDLVPFGTPSASSAAAPATRAPSAAKPSAAGKDATFSPSISGELLDLGKNALAGFVYSGSSAVLENGKIKVTFAAGNNYPNIQFPVPKGGWDLAAYSAISLTVNNPHDRKVKIALRVDNPGPWQEEPWNTESLVIGPGETKTISLEFGKQDGAPAFPLNPKRISAIQIFTIRPKADTTLLLSDLKGTGSPAAQQDSLALTSPADRNVPFTPPAWIGQRPPSEGNWVQTLNENFDGNKLNDNLWTARFPWGGPQPGQLQSYTPENISVANGIASLKVESRQVRENNDPTKPVRNIASGLIQSYDKFAQLYGYFEARVKLPTTRGLWPAFWMMPDRGAASGLNEWQRRSTANGAMEIDILEHLCEWGPGRNNVALHWDGYGDQHKVWGSSHIYFGPTPDGWHTFGLLWEPGKFTWYIDGKKTIEYADERVSNVPSYLKLNVQVGGWATKDVDLSKLPDYLQVDYVRVWQLRERMR